MAPGFVSPIAKPDLTGRNNLQGIPRDLTNSCLGQSKRYRTPGDASPRRSFVNRRVSLLAMRRQDVLSKTRQVFDNRFAQCFVQHMSVRTARHTQIRVAKQFLDRISRSTTVQQ
jgi:hypothetical protein